MHLALVHGTHRVVLAGLAVTALLCVTHYAPQQVQPMSDNVQKAALRASPSELQRRRLLGQDPSIEDELTILAERANQLLDRLEKATSSLRRMPRINPAAYAPPKQVTAHGDGLKPAQPVGNGRNAAPQADTASDRHPPSLRAAGVSGGPPSLSTRPTLCIATPIAKRPALGDDVVRRRLQVLADQRNSEKDVHHLRFARSFADATDMHDYARGLGFKVTVDNVGYPELQRDDLKQNFGDSITRVRWRTQEASDTVAALRLCEAEQRDYILLLQDDGEPAKHFTDKAMTRLGSIPDPNFGICSLYSSSNAGIASGFRRMRAVDDEHWFIGGDSNCGAVALLFPSSIVPSLTAYVWENRVERPVDWLIFGYLGHNRSLAAFEMVPNLIQHLSTQSTFIENKNRHIFKSFSFRFDDGRRV